MSDEPEEDRLAKLLSATEVDPEEIRSVVIVGVDTEGTIFNAMGFASIVDEKAVSSELDYLGEVLRVGNRDQTDYTPSDVPDRTGFQ